MTDATYRTFKRKFLNVFTGKESSAILLAMAQRIAEDAELPMALPTVELACNKLVQEGELTRSWWAFIGDGSDPAILSDEEAERIRNGGQFYYEGYPATPESLVPVYSRARETDVEAYVYEQHVELAKVVPDTEKHYMLLDADAAEKLALAREQKTYRFELLRSGVIFDTDAGSLRVVRVPDTNGMPMLVDDWGQTVEVP